MTKNKARSRAKKPLAALLAIVMCMSLLPAAVFAAPPDTGVGAGSTLGIEGDFVSGDEWDSSVAKKVLANIQNITRGQKAYLKIELAKGMVLDYFPWKPEWGTVPSEISPVSASADMSGAAADAFTEGEISYDGTTGAVTLIYGIGEDTEGINFQQVQLALDYRYAYNGLVIQNAVKLSLLDGNKQVLGTEDVYNVKAKTDLFRHTRGGTENLYPGDKDRRLFTSRFFMPKKGQEFGQFPTDKVNLVTYKLDDCIEEVTRVEIPTVNCAWAPESPNDFWNWDGANHILTVKNLVYTNRDAKGGSGYIHVYGNVSEGANNTGSTSTHSSGSTNIKLTVLDGNGGTTEIDTSTAEGEAYKDPNTG